MSQVNLLPPEILQGQKVKRLTLAVIVVGACIVALVFGFYLLQVKRLADVHHDTEAQQQTNAQFQQDIADLQHFEDLQVQAQQKENLLSTAYAGEVSMSELLMDLSRVTPSESYIDSLTITLTQASDTTGATSTDVGAPVFVGNLSLGGQAIGFGTLSTWLIQLEQIDGWVNPWMPNIASSDPTIDSFTFTVSIDLSTDVLTPRGQGQVTAGG